MKNPFVTWIYSIDCAICGPDAPTNRYYATLAFYYCLFLGGKSGYALLHDTYVNADWATALMAGMPVQMGIVALIILFFMVGSITTCTWRHGFIRFIVLSALLSLAYCLGALLPTLAYACVALAALAYLWLCVKIMAS